MTKPLTPSPSKKPKVFIAMPYHDRFDKIYKVIRKAVEAVGAEAIRMDKLPQPGNVPEMAHEHLKEAGAVLAVITDRSANVMYEIGYARGCSKEAMPIMQNPPPNTPPNQKWRYRTPFLLIPTNTVFYDEADLAKLKADVIDMLNAWRDKYMEPPTVNIAGTDIQEGDAQGTWQRVEIRGKRGWAKVSFDAYLRNDTKRVLPAISHADLHCTPDPDEHCLIPHSFKGPHFKSYIPEARLVANKAEFHGLTKRYRLSIYLPPLHPEAEEKFNIVIRCKLDKPEIKEPFLLRICMGDKVFNFPYNLIVRRR